MGRKVVVLQASTEELVMVTALAESSDLEHPGLGNFGCCRSTDQGATVNAKAAAGICEDRIEAGTYFAGRRSAAGTGSAGCIA